MATVEYNLSAPVALNTMIPNMLGVPTNIPAALNGTGLYLIYNENTNNRYMGISNDIRHRFQVRQGVCFDLGFDRNDLNGIYAFTGTMRYQNTNSINWHAAPGYVTGALNFNLDGFVYDLEHMFIKSVQYADFGGGSTITNTQKVNPLQNNHATHDIDVVISWLAGAGFIAGNETVTINAGAQLN